MTVSLSKFQMIIGRMFCGGSLLAFAFAVALAPAAAETVTIKIKSGPNRFEPKTATIKPGDTVMWMDEAGHHTATPDDNQPDPFKGSPEMDPPNTYTVVIYGSPRTIKYHCEIHGPMMSGEIVVAP
jgi:plastocyanin